MSDMYFDAGASGWSETEDGVDVPGWRTVWYWNETLRLYGVHAKSERNYEGHGNRFVRTIVSVELVGDKVAAAKFLAVSWNAEAEANL